MLTAGLYAPAPADWERISSRVDMLSAKVMSLLRRVESMQKRLEALSGVPGSPAAESRATPDTAVVREPNDGKMVGEREAAQVTRAEVSGSKRS